MWQLLVSKVQFRFLSLYQCTRSLLSLIDLPLISFFHSIFKSYTFYYTSCALMFVESINPSSTQKLKQMFIQVQNIVINMLENIGYIYKTNGLSYQIKQFEQVILKIVCPVELFSCQNSWKSIYNRDPISDSQSTQIHKKVSLTNGVIGSNWAPSYPKPPDQSTDRADYNNFPKRKSYLGQQIEEQICRRAYMNVKKGISICKKDIIFDAVRLAKQKGLVFQGSSGWFTRFLSRNPRIRELISTQKIARRQQQKQQEEKSEEQWKLQISENSKSSLDQARNNMMESKTEQNQQSRQPRKSQRKIQQVYLESNSNEMISGDIYGSEDDS